MDDQLEPQEISLCDDCPESTERSAEGLDIRVPVEEQNVSEQVRKIRLGEHEFEISANYHPKAWYAFAMVEKYHGDNTDGEPYEVIKSEPNLLTDGGGDYILDRIIGAGAATVFNNANSRLCVGNGTTTPAAGDTDLSGASKLRKAMDATFPSRTSHTVTFKSTFATTDANFAWNEWGISNSAAGAILMNHSLKSFGTKTSSDTWVLTVTVTVTG